MVTFKNTKGYLLRSAMAKQKASSGSSKTSSKFVSADVNAVTLTDLKLYEDASLFGGYIDTVPAGTQVHVTGYKSQAAYVEINGKKGYLERGYLKNTK